MKARLTSLSSPSRITIKKNNIDHRGATGISATAAGYATNAKPGPDKICNSNKNYIIGTFLHELFDMPFYCHASKI